MPPESALECYTDMTMRNVSRYMAIIAVLIGIAFMLGCGLNAEYELTGPNSGFTVLVVYNTGRDGWTNVRITIVGIDKPINGQPNVTAYPSIAAGEKVDIDVLFIPYDAQVRVSVESDQGRCVASRRMRGH